MASDLHILQCPAAFAEFAAKHNALVDLLLNMTGRNGVDVIATEGNVVIEGDGTGLSTEGAAVDVVQSDGKLVSVTKRSDAGTPTNYPTVLKVVNSSTSVLIDSNGLTITNGSGYTCTIAFSSMARNLAIRTISVCDGGTTKSMDVLSSAAY